MPLALAVPIRLLSVMHSPEFHDDHFLSGRGNAYCVHNLVKKSVFLLQVRTEERAEPKTRSVEETFFMSGRREARAYRNAPSIRVCRELESPIPGLELPRCLLYNH
jgi:hypothetical protein